MSTDVGAIGRIVAAMEIDTRRSNPMRAPGFCDRVSVEVWDAWFRWRDETGLRDADVEATCRRVSTTLASVEGAAEASWAREFESLLRGWHALPDARVLTAAGTGCASWPSNKLAAVVNIATCVRDPFTPQARLDLVAIEHAAAVSVRMLDNAILLADVASAHAPRLQVGLIGLADALLMLGLAYDSAAAREKAQNVAASLALGCARESTRLAAERGTRVAQGNVLASAHGVGDVLAGDDVASHRLRHAQLTAITSQRRLALLANNVANALDPLRGHLQIYRIEGPDGGQMLRSSGSTLAQLGWRPRTPAETGYAIDTIANVPRAAQLAMRAAMQPWIDAPIDYALDSASSGTLGD